jgi:hypothetical protein
VTERYTALAAAKAKRAYEQRKADNQAVQALYPSLSMRLWAETDGMHIEATVDMPIGHGKTRYKILQRAVWQPNEVTEELVVDWGRRALVRHLESLLENVDKEIS